MFFVAQVVLVLTVGANLIKPLFLHGQKVNTKSLNILRMKRAFKIKKKFIVKRKRFIGDHTWYLSFSSLICWRTIIKLKEIVLIVYYEIIYALSILINVNNLKCGKLKCDFIKVKESWYKQCRLTSHVSTEQNLFKKDIEKR